MEIQSLNNTGDNNSEDFPDEFKCCVCLDLMYKPVVLACGHISCFWCVFTDMCNRPGSQCPICRNDYNHFPRVCTLLHFLLLKVYPSAYKRREKEVAEEEEVHGDTSPQFEDNLVNSRSNEGLDVQNPSPLPNVPMDSNLTCRGDPFPNEENITTTNATNDTVEYKHRNGNYKEVILKDLQCTLCKQLLCRPLVLICGHVYCESCINNLEDSVCKCPVCSSSHPSGFPNVCLVLEHFLEDHFPEEYSARKALLANTHSCTSVSKVKKEQTDCTTDFENSSHGQVHIGAGCDYCGRCPIIGNRYKCNDCVEQIGFDLCEECYHSSSKLPGRFNQQHTEDHKFSVISLPNHEDEDEDEDEDENNGNIILRFESDVSDDEELNLDMLNVVFEDDEHEIELDSLFSTFSRSEDQGR